MEASYQNTKMIDSDKFQFFINEKAINVKYFIYTTKSLVLPPFACAYYGGDKKKCNVNQLENWNLAIFIWFYYIQLDHKQSLKSHSLVGNLSSK